MDELETPTARGLLPLNELADRASQAELPPRERIDTLPAGFPKYTLGFAAASWMHDNIRYTVNQDKGPEPFRVTPRQFLFLLWFYAVDEDGRWLYQRGVNRQAKGFGKSPFAAAICLFELLGPCRFRKHNPAAPGGVEGRTALRPQVLVVATAEKQTDNTMRPILDMCAKGTPLQRKYQLEPTATRVVAPLVSGRLQQSASSASTSEGMQVTFALCDETEHWVPNSSNRGDEVMAAVKRNAAKVGGRVMETANAWTPGARSVAESTYDTWCQQEAGELVDDAGQLLYDALIAPPNTNLHDRYKRGRYTVSEGLHFIYENAPWQLDNLPTIRSQILSVDTTPAVSRQFYLNQPSSPEGAWLPAGAWDALADHKTRLKRNDEIVLFFDGSKSNDYTALTACRVSDGFVQTLKVWKPRPKPIGTVDVADVDKAVRAAASTFRVVAFWADVKEFESFVNLEWPRVFQRSIQYPAAPGKGLEGLVAWDMRSHTGTFAKAVETVHNEVVNRAFRHSGDHETSVAVANARVRDYRGWLYITKESPKSPKKIDAAVTAIGARMLRNHVVSLRQNTHTGGRGFTLDHL